VRKYPTLEPAVDLYLLSAKGNLNSARTFASDFFAAREKVAGILHFVANGPEQAGIIFESGEVGELFFDVLGSVKQKPAVGFGEHGSVVEGVARSDHFVTQPFEGGHGFFLLIVDAQEVIRYAVIGDLKPMAEKGGPAELAHERFRKFLERVGQNDDLCEGAQFVEKLLRPGQRAQRADDFLNFGETKIIFRKNFQATLHEHVIVGYVASGEAELFDSGLFGEGDPDFGDEHPLEVERNN